MVDYGELRATIIAALNEPTQWRVNSANAEVQPPPHQQLVADPIPFVSVATTAKKVDTPPTYLQTTTTTELLKSAFLNFFLPN